jgi:hypothetical protein
LTWSDVDTSFMAENPNAGKYSAITRRADLRNVYRDPDTSRQPGFPSTLTEREEFVLEDSRHLQKGLPRTHDDGLTDGSSHEPRLAHRF